MIGYQWTVYHCHSAYNSDGILATGITDDPEKARLLVELFLTKEGHAAWGLLLRVALDPGPDVCGSDDTPVWPPPGQIQACRRTTNDELRWAPLYPV